MSNEIQISYTVNDTDIIYAVLRNPAKQVRNVATDTWEAHPASGSLDNYDISPGTASGRLWGGDFPANVANGFYIVQARKRAGATPDCSDEVFAAEKGYWDGITFREALDANGMVKLASDGLDSVSVTEPSGDPAGWNFRQLFMWFMARLKNKHEKDSTNQELNVYNTSDVKMTKQSYTTVGGDETVDKIAQP